MIVRELEGDDVETYNLEDIASAVIRVWNREAPKLVKNMIHGQCFECGSAGQCHSHHVIPRSKGGTKTIPLCERCHGLVHGLDFTNHGNLIKSGLAEARRKGVKLGRERKSSSDILAEYPAIVALLGAGMSIRSIAKECVVAAMTVQKVKRVLSRIA